MMSNTPTAVSTISSIVHVWLLIQPLYITSQNAARTRLQRTIPCSIAAWSDRGDKLAPVTFIKWCGCSNALCCCRFSVSKASQRQCMWTLPCMPLIPLCSTPVSHRRLLTRNTSKSSPSSVFKGWTHYLYWESCFEAFLKHNLSWWCEKMWRKLVYWGKVC